MADILPTSTQVLPPGEDALNAAPVLVEIPPIYEPRPAPARNGHRPTTTFGPRPRGSNEALGRSGLEDNAHIWTVYGAEADRYDTEMLREWKETANLLTTFSGLLSVVLAAFLTIASSGGIPGHATSLWIYALWATSISISLSVSVFCLNSRQWLSSFHPLPELRLQNPKQKALIRQFRHNGLEKWKLPLVMDLLPQFLNLSIFLFFAGLIQFLHPVSQLIATVIITITGITFFLYVTSTLLPILSPPSPYATPVTHLAYGVMRQFAILPEMTTSPSLAQKELAVASDPHGYLLAASALSWLYATTNDPAAHLAIFEALPGFEKAFSSSSHSESGPELMRSIQDITTLSFKRPNIVYGLFHYFLRTANEDSQWPRSRQGRRLGRACKLYFGREDGNSERLWVQLSSPESADGTFPETVRSVLRIVNDPAMARPRRGVHFPDPPRRPVLDRQMNQSIPTINPGRPEVRPIPGTLVTE